MRVLLARGSLRKTRSTSQSSGLNEIIDLLPYVSPHISIKTILLDSLKHRVFETRRNADLADGHRSMRVSNARSF